MKILKVFKKFERYNFHGVPETPRPQYERGVQGSREERDTRMSIPSSSSNNVDISNMTLIGYIDIENEDQFFFVDEK